MNRLADMKKPLVLICNQWDKKYDALAHSLGINLIIKPMIKTQLLHEKQNEIIALAKKNTADAWVFTSKNAVEFFLNIKEHLNYSSKIFFAVGVKTARPLQAIGLPVNIPEQENATALAQLMLDKSVKNVLFWCGNRRRNVLPKLFKEAQIGLEELVVYHTIESPNCIEEDYDAIAFLSASAVESFIKKNYFNAQKPLFAIGKTTADTLRNNTQQKIYIPPKPHIDLLLQAISKHFSN